jgi:hypothetical protein
MRGLALLLSTLLLGTLGFAGSRTDEAPGTPEVRDPRFVNIAGACNPNETGAVQPPSIRIRRLDNVVWRSVSPNAASWVITPKVAGDWPFATPAHAGSPQTDADSGLPVEGAQAERPYRYNVTVTCADGSQEVIDPEIVIGDDS